MLKKDRPRREASSINAGSMADIAFLLLIFFLVTTTILEDQGILVRLPIWDANPPPIITLVPSNLMRVSLNAQNKLLVRDKFLTIDELRENTVEFILNPRKRPELSSAPNKALISLMHDRSTEYETYLSVYNELKAAYHEIWEGMAQRDYAKSYEDLPDAHKRAIQEIVPMVISEAEPTDFL